MRNDLPSMNAGKAMAQASHASNALVHEWTNVQPLKAEHIKMAEGIALWQKQTSQGFGTVLVLAVNRKELIDTISVARTQGFAASVVDDPTYPYRAPKELADLIPVATDTAPRIEKGNEVTLFRNEMTCGYVFADRGDEKTSLLLGRFPLHP